MLNSLLLSPAAFKATTTCEAENELTKNPTANSPVDVSDVELKVIDDGYAASKLEGIADPLVKNSCDSTTTDLLGKEFSEYVNTDGVVDDVVT